MAGGGNGGSYYSVAGGAGGASRGVAGTKGATGAAGSEDRYSHGGGGGGGADAAGGAGSGAGGSAGTAANPNGGSGGYGGGGGGGYSNTGAAFPTDSTNGGYGGDGGAGFGNAGPGGGGAGGYGEIVAGEDPGTNKVKITGGAGGSGGECGNDSGTAGYGGGGGTGVQLTANGAIATNNGTIQGGSGGNAGTSSGLYGPSDPGGVGGAGGAGGAGLTASSATITNRGTVSGGAGGAGQYFYGTQYDTGGAGGAGGVGIADTSATITNSGTIAGGAGGPGGGVNVYVGGTKGAGGAGGAGIVGSNLAIINSGSITGGAGGRLDSPDGSQYGAIGPTANAIEFTGGSNSLTLGSTTNGTTTIGTLSGGIGVTGSLTLATPANATLSNVIHDGAGAGALVYDSTSTLTLSGVNTFSGGTTIDAGTLSISADSGLGATTGKLVLAGGTLEATAPLSSARFIDLNASSTIQVDAGSGTTPAITSLTGTISGGGNDVLTKTGTGTLALSGTNTIASVTVGAGTLDLTQATAGAKVITFAGSQATPATLMLESAAQPTMGAIAAPGPAFGDKLTNFGANNALDLAGFTYSALDTATLGTTNGAFTVTFADNSGDATTGKTESFSLGGTLSAAYIVQDGGSNGVLIEAVTCFAQGTRIRTTRDDVAVEDLRVGDLAVTVSGAARPIRWLGHRTIDCRRHPRPQEAMPIRIAAHALGDNRPARDLRVSPGHAICLDLLGEVLVPAIALVNGATITQDDVDSVTYWHVELDAHDIILAENVATESYLDVGNRSFFAEADVTVLDATPDAPSPTTSDYCRPFHTCESKLVAVVRDQLRARARTLGWRLAAPAAPDDLWLEVDGVRVDPARNSLVARATLPATAREVFLCSTSAVPAQTTGEPDGRKLGAKLAGLTIDDGLACRREIACGDPRLADGFHDDEGTHRWSDGRARLPAELWERVAGDFFLRIALAGPVLPGWEAPAAADAVAKVA